MANVPLSNWVLRAELFSVQVWVVETPRQSGGARSPAGAKAELRPGECEAGLGRCTAPSQGAGRARRGRASVPMLLFLPSTLRSSSLGCPPTLAPPSTGSQLCSTLRFPCQPPLYRSQILRGEGYYWASWNSQWDPGQGLGMGWEHPQCNPSLYLGQTCLCGMG